MSKNTGPDKLAREMEKMPGALESIGLSRSGSAVILARLVRGISSEGWEKICADFQLEQWHALPVAPEAENDEELECLRQVSSYGLPVSPFREVAGALTRSMFVSLLQREMLRISRNGGSLSLVSASLADRRSVVDSLGEDTARRLEAILGVAFLKKMDSCDALGLVRPGMFVCSLPGIGQLGARRFAETVQQDFSCAARPFFPAGGTGGNAGNCALGIVNILQGESCSPEDLLKRARATLDVALRKQAGFIHQEAAIAPFEGTTLVHSSEKRFLFFGGDPE